MRFHSCRASVLLFIRFPLVFSSFYTQFQKEFRISNVDTTFYACKKRGEISWVWSRCFKTIHRDTQVNKVSEHCGSRVRAWFASASASVLSTQFENQQYWNQNLSFSFSSLGIVITRRYWNGHGLRMTMETIQVFSSIGIFNNVRLTWHFLSLFLVLSPSLSQATHFSYFIFFDWNQSCVSVVFRDELFVCAHFCPSIMLKEWD